MRYGVLFFIFFVSTLAVGVYVYYVYFNILPEVTVPEVVGMSFSAAQEKLAQFNLRARKAGEAYEPKYPEGYVVSQRPEAGRKVKVGRTVNLLLSSRQKLVLVPNFLGRQFSSSYSLLATVGLQLGEVKKEKNPDLEEGTILAQEPLPGEEVPAGSRIDLLLSTTLEVTEKAEGERND
jgi:serine/threonine-protein kinase